MVKMDAKWDLLVTGVYKDLPRNSEFREATYFAPLDLYLDGWSPGSLNTWDNYHVYIYAQLRPGADHKQVSAIIKDAMLPHMDEDGVKSKPEVFLHPMKDWHLYSKFENGKAVTSDELKFVRLYGIIGAFVLLLACINFMNLSTARSSTRAKEVGVRKTIGSLRSQLVSWPLCWCSFPCLGSMRLPIRKWLSSGMNRLSGSPSSALPYLPACLPAAILRSICLPSTR
jgi:hypothetical protein